MNAIQTPEIWAAESAMVGHTPVLRPLPTRAVRSIGPFVFLDHFGPAPTRPGTLPAHPHAGIEVMTYLIEGANTHRDSAGHEGSVAAGGAQWMRAGRGVLHAETIRAEGAPVTHGLQIWAKLARGAQDSDPAYRGFDAAEFPVWMEGGTQFKLLAGSLAGRRGPITLSLDAFMLHVSVATGGSFAINLPGHDHRYGVYGVTGKCRLDDAHPLLRGDFARLPENVRNLRFEADPDGPAEVFVLGGEAAPEPLVFGGPFVMDSAAALAEAERRFSSGDMGALDGVPF